jgi:hypothetical protein
MVEVRYAPKDMRLHPLAKQSYPGVLGAEDNIGLRIGAAVDTNLAYGSDWDNKSHGDFTWFWVKALTQAKSDDTWQTVYARTKALMANQPRIKQEPQLAGNGNRTVFGGQFTAFQPGVTVTKVDPNTHNVTLAAGTINGVTQDSTYKLLLDGNGKTCLTVSHADVFESVADYTSLCKPTVGSQVAEVSHRYTLTPIRLHLKADYPNDKDKVLLNRLRQSLNTLNGFTLVDDNTRADWVVYLVRPENKGDTAQQLPTSHPERPPQAWVVDQQGQLIHERLKTDLADPSAGITKLIYNLKHYARIQEFNALTGSLPAPIELISTLYHPVASRQPTDNCLPKPINGKSYCTTDKPVPLAQLTVNPPRLNDLITYQVRNTGNEAVFVYVLNVTPEGGIDNVFPRDNDSQDSARITPAADTDQQALKNLGKFTLFDSQGETTLKVITANQAIDFNLFALDNLKGEESFSADTPLERFLIGNLESRNSSGDLGVGDWGTEQVAFGVQ